MPRMDQASPQQRLIKMLLIGAGKIGKTRWAGMAANAGFNVLYLDGDVGGQTLGMLPPEAQRRIYLLNIGDTILGGNRDHRFIDNIKAFVDEAVFRWNDTQQKLGSRLDPVTDDQWEIRPALLDHRCVLVIDSWTSLTQSMMLKASRLCNVQMEVATTEQMRPVYQQAGLASSLILQTIRSMRCHVIVIGHPDEYVHKSAPDGRKVSDVKEKDLIIDYTKMIPKSTSKPNGLSMAPYFTDIAWMDTNAAGTERILDFRLDPGRVSGGHFHERKNSDEYSFANLVKQIGGTVPDGNQSVDQWLKIIPGGKPGEVESAAPASPVLDGTKPAPLKGAGITSLFAKPAAAQGS